MGEVLRTMGSAADAVSPRMVRTSLRFWPWRLPHRRRLLRRCRPTADQAGKPDSPEYQTGSSSFPEDSRSSRAATQAIEAKIRKCSDIGGGGCSLNQEGPKSKTLTNDNEAKPDAEKGPEVVAVKQNKAQDEETWIRVEAVASF
jgi:hypothetical protein